MAKSATQSAVMKMNIAGTVQQIFGWFFAVLFGLFSVGGATHLGKNGWTVGTLLLFLVITAGGILLILSGRKKKKLVRTFKKYTVRLAADATKSIDLLAETTGTAIDVVVKNVKKMINAGFFSNAYLDMERHCIVFANENQAYKPSVPRQPSAAGSYVTVQCGGCGATNKIASGTVGECEFCGSKISGTSGK